MQYDEAQQGAIPSPNDVWFLKSGDESVWGTVAFLVARFVKVVLKLVDIDGNEVHKIAMDVAAIPDAEDYTTFEVQPGNSSTATPAALRHPSH